MLVVWNILELLIPLALMVEQVYVIKKRTKAWLDEDEGIPLILVLRVFFIIVLGWLLYTTTLVKGVVSWIM